MSLRTAEGKRGLARLIGLRLTSVTLFADFFELTFDTRHMSTERGAGIIETHLTVYAQAAIETDPERGFADALHALVGSTVVETAESTHSAELTLDNGKIVATLHNADMEGDEAIHLVEKTLVVEAWDFVAPIRQPDA